MRFPSKYDIIGFFSSLILHICFVFFIIKLANSPFIPSKPNFENSENILTIELRNFIQNDSLNGEFSENLENLEDEFENLEKEFENSQISHVFPQEIQKEILEEKLEEISQKNEILPKKQEIKKPNLQTANKENKKRKNLSKQTYQNPNFGDKNLSTQINGNANGGDSNSQISSNQKNANYDISEQIKAIVAKYAKQNYPSEAKKLGQTGIVGVGFYYTTEKKIENLQILRSSGFANLDNAALNAVKKTKSQFPKPSQTDYFKFNINFSLTN